MSTQTTLPYEASEPRDESTCQNGHEYCCGPDGIHFSDNGETIEHEGHFPDLDCFMEAYRTKENGQ